MTKTILALGTFSFLLFSCGESKTDTTLTPSEKRSESKMVAGSQTEEEIKEQAAEYQKVLDEVEKEKRAKLTSMSFNEEIHDFGLVGKTSENKYVFIVKNTGDKPLTITDAKASCGCTTPSIPKEPILPGGTAEMPVVFKPKEGQAGQMVKKDVTVFANVEGGQSIISIKAEVEK